jgi:uncharacterized membrane protein YhhN
VKVALLVATALVAAADWWSRWKDDDRIERFAKPLATIGVIGLALVSGAPQEQVAVAVVALVLCLAGDVFLMPAIDRFVFGLASFLLGHLVFIILFIQYGLESAPLAGIALVLAGLLIASVGQVIVRGARQKDPGLRTPVLAYLCVISSMAAFGWATGLPWVIAGTTLFVVSDSILGWGQFVHRKGWMPVAIMVTYHGAIGALALSLW